MLWLGQSSSNFRDSRFPLHARPGHPGSDRRDQFGSCGVGAAGVERWGGGVFDAKLDALRNVLASNFGNHRQGEIDPGGDSAAGHEFAVANDSAFGWDGAERHQQVGPGPVGGGFFCRAAGRSRPEPRRPCRSSRRRSPIQPASGGRIAPPDRPSVPALRCRVERRSRRVSGNRPGWCSVSAVVGVSLRQRHIATETGSGSTYQRRNAVEPKPATFYWNNRRMPANRRMTARMYRVARCDIQRRPMAVPTTAPASAPPE